MASKPHKHDGHYDLIPRGVYRTNLPGILTLVGLRALDPFLQYSILAHDLAAPVLHRLGLQTLPRGLPARTGFALLDGLQLSPFRLVLLAMSAGTSTKQILTLLTVTREEMTPSMGVAVSFVNSLFNSANSVAFTTCLFSASLDSDANFPQAPLLAGAVLYVLGMGVEVVSEAQRASFKTDPKNRGKPYTGGLFGLARHINYGGYAVWRTGYALAAGGWIWGGLVGVMAFWDFATRAVPVLDGYCAEKVSLEALHLCGCGLIMMLVRRHVARVQAKNTTYPCSVHLVDVCLGLLHIYSGLDGAWITSAFLSWRRDSYITDTHHFHLWKLPSCTIKRMQSSVSPHSPAPARQPAMSGPERPNAPQISRARPSRCRTS
jgi:protein-S-isoprenylcysteine O-methyltransferase Ste14